MIRRLNSWVLIALVAGAAPVRAADVADGRRATVEVQSASPAQLARLGQAVRATGASMRVVRCGSWARFEIVSATRARLSAALAALERRADGSGLPVRSERSDGSEGLEAVSAKPDGATRAPADGHPASAVLCPPPRTELPSPHAGPPAGQSRPPDPVAAASPPPRGPPART